jgi:hypothetical protein
VLLEHGLDPGPELQHLQLRLLREDGAPEQALTALSQ